MSLRPALPVRAELATASRVCGSVCGSVYGRVFGLVLAACGLAWGSGVCAQTGAALAASSATSAVTRSVERGPTWSSLSAAQKNALRPLERDWASIDAGRKSKWLGISQQFPSMAPLERERVQDRMAEWARLTPQQRGLARLQFKEAQQVPPDNRRVQWEAYQALPAENKRQLAAQAATAAASGNSAGAQKSARDEQLVRNAGPQKSNIVVNPGLAAPPKAIAPTVMQAQPGATTTLISKRPAPPAHQQTGLPKIAGSPDFVDKATLLPQRGPQGAAITSANAAVPVPRP